jgi:hypothetical protein
MCFINNVAGVHKTTITHEVPACNHHVEISVALSLGMVRLNRASHHFFFQDCDPDTPHQFGDEVENHGP